jgi:hypothetical protein
MDRLLNIEYNSEKENLIISEYGRHIQNLINYAKTIEDPQEQQVVIEEIVELMKKMKIGNKKSPEYKEKIWMHVYKIANYELKAVPPTGDIPTPKPEGFKPQKLNYPSSERHFRHYGHFIHLLMDKAIAMEDGQKKNEFVALIGAYMKLAYKTWSPEHFVNDKNIKEDLKRMTKGKLIFPEGYSLDILLDKFKERKNNNGKKRNMSRKKQRRN